MTEGKWISIIEYATQSGNSISTTRRYIKSGKILSKQIDGKYFIYYSNVDYDSNNDKSELIFLKNTIKKLNNEIEDLRTLLMLYETQFKSPEELEQQLIKGQNR